MKYYIKYTDIKKNTYNIWELDLDNNRERYMCGSGYPAPKYNSTAYHTSMTYAWRKLDVFFTSELPKQITKQITIDILTYDEVFLEML